MIIAELKKGVGGDAMVKITSENRGFYDAVYSVVMLIPEGKVTTYGHIAELVHRPANSRQVGSALKHAHLLISQLATDNDEPMRYSYDQLPWQRVVGAGGKISPRSDSHGELEQVTRLRHEGIAVSDAHVVNLERYGWFPDDVEW